MSGVDKAQWSQSSLHLTPCILTSPVIAQHQGQASLPPIKVMGVDDFSCVYLEVSLNV